MLITEDVIEEANELKNNSDSSQNEKQTEILDQEKFLEQEKHRGLSSRMFDVSVSENVQSLDEKSRKCIICKKVIPFNDINEFYSHKLSCYSKKEKVTPVHKGQYNWREKRNNLLYCLKFYNNGNELKEEKTLVELTCRFCNKTVKGPLRNHFKECTAQKRKPFKVHRLNRDDEAELSFYKSMNSNHAPINTKSNFRAAHNNFIKFVEHMKTSKEKSKNLELKNQLETMKRDFENGVRGKIDLFDWVVVPQNQGLKEEWLCLKEIVQKVKEVKNKCNDPKVQVGLNEIVEVAFKRGMTIVKKLEHNPLIN
ncbi:hypothetical protein ABK040_004774 [Willaertia magna]